ncbi:sigma-70 family RNA polymerase sigma factor [Streptomyces nigra]|uniref:RNA polymerase sigma factor n=1 Tax=Streptomyces nigra TaxID=1827580 RepID=UPI003451A799
MHNTVPSPSAVADGFDALYAAYRPRVEGYIASRLPRRDSQLAEDLAAEVFASLWRSRYAQGRPVEGAPWSLLATIAQRRITDHYRVMRNYRETAADMTSWQYANRVLASDDSGAMSPVSSGFRRQVTGGAA